MSPDILGLVALASLFLFIFVGFPIAFTLLFIGLVTGYIGIGPVVFHLMTLQVYAIMNEQVLAAGRADPIVAAWDLAELAEDTAAPAIVRATARWLKHVVTFEGWLDYIVRKASRHGGAPIVLTERERRWPLVFLWGRLFAFLRSKNRKGSPR